LWSGNRKSWEKKPKKKFWRPKTGDPETIRYLDADARAKGREGTKGGISVYHPSRTERSTEEGFFRARGKKSHSMGREDLAKGGRSFSPRKKAMKETTQPIRGCVGWGGRKILERNRDGGRALQLRLGV